MWVELTPAMSAATADTPDNSSYQDLSIGSRESAKAADRRGDEIRRRLGVAAAVGGDQPRLGQQGRVEQLAALEERRPRGRADPASKKRGSAVASIEVNTRNGLRASSSASMGRNAVDTTGTGDGALRRS